MQRPSIVLAAIAVVYAIVGLTGCASAPHVANSSVTGKPRVAADNNSAISRLSAMLSGRNKAPEKPPFEKSYTELQSDFAGTGVVSPRIGYAAPEPEPTGLKKWTSAVAGSSVVTSIKTAFAPKDTTGSAPAASNHGFNFLSKKDEGETGGSVSVFTESSMGPDIYVVMARRKESSGQLDQAAEQYRKALDIEKHHLLATTGLARLLDRQGQQEEAQDLFVDATKHHPKSASAWNDLGTFHAQHQHNGDAIRAMQRAVALDPQRDLYRNNLAMFLVEAGQPQQALAHLQAIHPPAVAHYSLGYLLKEQGQISQAMAYFRAAYQQDPQFEEARLAIELLAGQNSPVYGQHPTRSPLVAAASPSAPPVTLDHTGLENTAPDYATPEDMTLEAHRPPAPSGRVALHGDTSWPAEDQPDGGDLAEGVDEIDIAADADAGTDEQAVTRPWLEQQSQRPLRSVVQPEPYNDHLHQTETTGSVRFTMLPEETAVPEDNNYEADTNEVEPLATQFAPADGEIPTRDADAGNASIVDDDDPLSRALRQAVEEGDASVRRW